MLDANKRRALCWNILGSCCFTTGMTLAKFLSPEVKGIILVFFRCLFGLLFFSPFLIKAKVDVIKTKRLPLHLLRVGFVCAAIACTYYGYRNLPLALATTLGFTAPLFTMILAIIILQERVRPLNWFLLALGYSGVLVIARPNSFDINHAVYILLLANFFASCSTICSKKLTATEPALRMMLYLNTLSTLLAGCLACFYWIQPIQQDFLILLALGALGVSAQYCILRSLQIAAPSFLAPFDYMRLIIAVPIGYLVFGEVPTWHVALGSGIIILSTALLLRVRPAS